MTATTVTLHPPAGAGPQALASMARDLRALAGRPGRVRSGRGGLVVDDALALAYLSTRPGVQVPNLPGPGPVPGGVARLVRNAEQRAGMADPAEGEHKPPPAVETTPEPAVAVATPATKPAARRRRVAARPVEEQA